MSITINLLPWREARRQRRTRRFAQLVILMLLLGVGLGLGASQLYQQKLAAQQQRNAYITQQLERLNSEIADVQRYQASVARLGEQLTLFQTLQGERASTVKLFNDIAASVVDGVVYQRLARSGDRVSISAMAGNERQVSEQLRQIADMPGLGVPLLSEVASGQDGTSRVFQFEVVQVLPGSEESAP
ncbi:MULTISPECIES: PilN domain-containing protein [Halomonadaceae]|uniref:Pilus assembly protein PilN n=1 Tax=Halomonas johnsoniae TaxID=502832 RepID=A0ABQ2WEQ9_9GAMM|nr:MULTISPECIES: PilN domain-containing protein [Halomonas]ATH77881.1 fimbrial assembly protein [Halomonas hydrothermalis]KHJ50761.1 fimbrial assembly protein [Halomonas hydrothermalis]UDM06581.1 fimbrial assembly protein [Halomonas sp. NyZ770]GGW47366.1 pilus assembly protein PilN [Halomonas johnsoniae]